MQTIDLATTELRTLNQTLHNAAADSTAAFAIDNPDGRHNIAVGVNAPLQITVRGHTGYYCAGMNQLADITINGNAGAGLAENILSGTVRVEGNASQYCAATAWGGTVIVKGDAASRCGIAMKGVDLIVGGSVGSMSGFMAQSGRLVICGDAGDALGDSLYEARIYLRGQVKSLGADCVEKAMHDTHRQELAELLDKAQMNHAVDEFRRYGSARRLYHFSIDDDAVACGRYHQYG